MQASTTESNIPGKKQDSNSELAVERTELAHERTHLAWIRTTFSIMTAGLAIDKGIAYIHEQRVEKDIALVKNAHVLGLILTIFGTLFLVAETIQFIARTRQLRDMRSRSFLAFSTSVVLASLVVILGCSLVWLMLTTG